MGPGLDVTRLRYHPGATDANHRPRNLHTRTQSAAEAMQAIADNRSYPVDVHRVRLTTHVSRAWTISSPGEMFRGAALALGQVVVLRAPPVEE